MKNNNYTSVSTKHFVRKAAIVSMILICISMQASAQAAITQTIRGIVKSEEENQPVPGTNIFLKSASSIGTLADENGQFEFPTQLKAGDIIVFSFIGLKTTEYVVPAQVAGLITITLPLDFIQMVDEVLMEGDEPTKVAVATPAKRSHKIKMNR